MQTLAGKSLFLSNRSFIWVASAPLRVQKTTDFQPQNKIIVVNIVANLTPTS